MTLDPDACYRAMLTHDARFDGAFFVGVRTTGVNCRPVCRARTPRRDSCIFFSHAAIAEREGFRACFRCRPERAPGHANIDAVSRLVGAAARKISEGALNERSVDDLASELGVGSRQLRRAMQAELGVGPIELALSRRVALARELLLGTSLPITEIAYASGFSSIRRFNSAYRDRQRMTPSEVRRPNTPRSEGVRVVLDVRPPFDPAPAFAFLRARAVSGSETFLSAGAISGRKDGLPARAISGTKAVLDGRDVSGSKALFGGTYVRATAIQGLTGLVSISPAKGRDAIEVEVSSGLAPALMPIVARVRRLFDTDADVATIGAHLCRDPRLRKHVKKSPALRVMGAFDPFEWSVRAVLGQQISVRAALTLASRLVARFGTPVKDTVPGLPSDMASPMFAWPDASRLASASETELAALGLTRMRARTLSHLAKAVAERRLVLERASDSASTLEAPAAREALLALPGIGPWTAEYIMMRALGWPDAFPSGDLGLRKALGNVSAAECERRSESWRPWRAYAAARLWASLVEGAPNAGREA